MKAAASEQAQEYHGTIMGLLDRSKIRYGEIGKMFYEFRQAKMWIPLGFPTLKAYVDQHKIPEKWTYHFSNCYATFTLTCGVPIDVWEAIDPSRLQEITAITTPQNVYRMLKMARTARTRRELVADLKRLRGEGNTRQAEGQEMLPLGVLFRLEPVTGDVPRRAVTHIPKDVFHRCSFWQDGEGKFYVQRRE